MTKFSTIWGDIDVNNVTPTEQRKDPLIENLKGEEEIREAVDEEEVEDSKQSLKKDPEPKPEAELELEFHEEDFGKTYAILKKAGIIELSEEEEDDLEASSEGLADAVAITVRNRYQKELESTPKEVQDLYAHLMAGNPFHTFKPSVDFSWEEVDVDNDDNKREALRLLYIDQGMTEEDALAEVDEVAESDKFDKKAEIAIDILIKKEQKLKAAQDLAEQQKEAEINNQRAKEIAEIEQTIDSSEEIAGFKLDETKRKKFKDYLFKVDPRSGKTQFLKNMASGDRKLKIAFLDFVDYTKADLEKEVASKLTVDRKKKLSSYSDANIKSTSAASVKSKVEAKGKLIFPSIFGKQTIEVED